MRQPHLVCLLGGSLLGPGVPQFPALGAGGITVLSPAKGAVPFRQLSPSDPPRHSPGPSYIALCIVRMGGSWGGQTLARRELALNDVGWCQRQWRPCSIKGFEDAITPSSQGSVPGLDGKPSQGAILK